VNKELCIKCKCKIAVWTYLPSEDDRYYCDDCVPRGCSCNIDPETGIEDTDGLGRLLPCCEYLYDEDGFSLDD